MLNSGTCHQQAFITFDEFVSNAHCISSAVPKMSQENESPNPSSGCSVASCDAFGTRGAVSGQRLPLPFHTCVIVRALCPRLLLVYGHALPGTYLLTVSGSGCASSLSPDEASAQALASLPGLAAACHPSAGRRHEEPMPGAGPSVSPPPGAEQAVPSLCTAGLLSSHSGVFVFYVIAVFGGATCRFGST